LGSLCSGHVAVTWSTGMSGASLKNRPPLSHG